MSIKICAVCNLGFNNKGTNRKKCFDCSPFIPNPLKSRNWLKFGEGQRQCVICKSILDNKHFSKTNKIGNLNSYCKTCASKKKFKSTHRFKHECINYKGGKCELCGYNKCESAMEFHHKNPLEKEFAISRSKTTLLTDDVKNELDKCMLLCANCHRELEQQQTLEKYNLTKA